MQRQRDSLDPIAGASAQVLHHFTQADQVNQLVRANEADPDMGTVKLSRILGQSAAASQRLGLSASGAGGQTPQVAGIGSHPLAWTSKSPTSNLMDGLIPGGRPSDRQLSSITPASTPPMRWTSRWDPESSNPCTNSTATTRSSIYPTRSPSSRKRSLMAPAFPVGQRNSSSARISIHSVGLRGSASRVGWVDAGPPDEPGSRGTDQQFPVVEQGHLVNLPGIAVSRRLTVLQEPVDLAASTIPGVEGQGDIALILLE